MLVVLLKMVMVTVGEHQRKKYEEEEEAEKGLHYYLIREFTVNFLDCIQHYTFTPGSRSLLLRMTPLVHIV